MPLAAIADVEALLRRAVTATELPYVTRLLGMADNAIEGELPGVSFTAVVTGASATFRRVVGDEVWLPGRPVVQVTEVTIGGEVVDPSRYVSSRWGPLRTMCGTWPTRKDIAVTWDYGFTTPPGDIVTIAADLVRNTMDDGHGKRQETIGQYSTTFEASTDALELSDDERRKLARWKTKRTSIPVESDNPWWDLPLTRIPDPTW